MSSVADTKRESAEGGGAAESMGALARARANPLALEIPVNATGTRPGSGPEHRELFTEETTTVLVFADGAVIRLSAAVATGQLIFLTNKATNVEVVSQVVGKRVHRPTSCYVELRFTEAMDGFWGVEFPADAEVPRPAVPDEAGQETVYELIESADPIQDDGAATADGPAGEELDELRERVGTLRRQVRELQEAKTSAKTVEEMVGADGTGTAAEFAAASERTGSSYEQKVEMLVPANEPAPIAPLIATAAPFEPAVVVTRTAAPPAVERSSHVGMSLPNRPQVKETIDAEQEAIDQLLPQPALDFSKAPIPERDPNDPYSIYKPTRAKMEKWTLGVLVLVLAGAVGFGIWSVGVVPRLVRWMNRTTPAAKTSEAPKRAPAAAEEGTQTAKPELKEAPANPEVNAEDTAVAEVKKPEEMAAKSRNAAPKNAVPKKVPKAEPKKKATATREPAAAPTEVAPVMEEGPLVPANLLKPVSPVYPPDAMRNFITGDVIMKAEVDEKGHVRNMEVVSGPKALRDAAMEALRKYEYQPATKGGKGVATWVKVTIKFWFDP